MQLGFDWGGFATNIANAGVQLAAARSSVKLSQAKAALENAQALAMQRAATAAALPPSAVMFPPSATPTYAPPYPIQGGIIPVHQQSALPQWAIPAGVGAAVLLALLVLRQQRV